MRLTRCRLFVATLAIPPAIALAPLPAQAVTSSIPVKSFAGVDSGCRMKIDDHFLVWVANTEVGQGVEYSWAVTCPRLAGFTYRFTDSDEFALDGRVLPGIGGGGIASGPLTERRTESGGGSYALDLCAALGADQVRHTGKVSLFGPDGTKYVARYRTPWIDLPCAAST